MDTILLNFLINSIQFYTIYTKFLLLNICFQRVEYRVIDINIFGKPKLAIAFLTHLGSYIHSILLKQSLSTSSPFGICIWGDSIRKPSITTIYIVHWDYMRMDGDCTGLVALHFRDTFKLVSVNWSSNGVNSWHHPRYRGGQCRQIEAALNRF